MPEKNQECELTIDGYGNAGEGIGRLDGYTLFVKGALPGERVRVIITKVKKHYGYARLLAIEEASPYRTEPRCPVAKLCGGCELQHIDYEEQLRFKEGRVRECLTRVGGVETGPLEVIGCERSESGYEPWHYRNKAQFPVGRDADGSPVIGFYASRSHRIVPCESCLLQDPQINRMITLTMSYVREIDRELQKNAPDSGTDLIYNEETHTGWLRHIYVRRGYETGQTMVCLVVNDRLGADYIQGAGKRYRLERLIALLEEEPGTTTLCLNENTERTNVVTGEKYITLTGSGYIEDEIGDIRFRIAPESFFQVNPHITKRLYDKALSFAALTGEEVVWDLYCGIGTISLCMAKQAKQVIGVEIVPQAIRDAGENARINGADNVTFLCGAAEVLIGQTELPRPDVVVVDPPRKGCDEKLIRAILEAGPSRIVYVSCDPATLARDIARLTEGGYELKETCVVDQFWQTRHVETVACLSKKP